MFAEDWQNTPRKERDYNHGLVPGGDQAAMFDNLWVALLMDPRNENTSHRDVFSNGPTPRFTVKSKINNDNDNDNDNEEQDCFSIFNTPIHGTGGRRVTLNTQQPENDGASRDACSRDIPPHLARCKGHEEVRGVPQYKQGSFGQRYQNLLPPTPSVLKSGPVRFFCLFWHEPDQDRSFRFKKIVGLQLQLLTTGCRRLRGQS